MRRVLNQAANAAVKAQGTIFAVVYRRMVPRLGHAQAIGAITHRLCRLIWKVLQERVRYEERGPAVSVEAKKGASAQDDPRTPQLRITFGSDTRASGPIVRRLESIAWLTAPQRRAILYDNAARFLRLDAQTIARHHGR